MSTKVASLIALFACFFSFQPKLFADHSSEPFEFQFENKTLRGLIEKPENKVSKAVVIIVPGYGRTNFIEGSYSRLRGKLLEAGLTICVWDKMGCGKSEGTFDAQQPVENSAEEAVVAIKKIKQMGIQGSDKIGLWGLSRAGWICPLINERYPVDFWISVSGTNDKENFGYLLKSNLEIEGLPEDEVEKYYQAWMLGHKLYSTFGSYEDYLNAIKPLTESEVCQKLFGYKKTAEVTEEGRKQFIKNQKNYSSKGHFDEESGLWVYIENFDSTLLKFNCPVLAIFGANDSQVDWRKTKALYEETIGQSTQANVSLETKVFEQCNHIIKSCVSCAYREDLSALDWKACDGYYETMEDWLKKNGFVE